MDFKMKHRIKFPCFLVHGRCEPSPCFNSGTCTILAHGYECTCPVGYLGVHCESKYMQSEILFKYYIYNRLKVHALIKRAASDFQPGHSFVIERAYFTPQNRYFMGPNCFFLSL